MAVAALAVLLMGGGRGGPTVGVRVGVPKGVKAGGAITRGDRLAINSTAGDVKSVEAIITAAPGVASVRNLVGIAETSAASGDIFPMWIQPYSVNIAVS